MRMQHALHRLGRVLSSAGHHDLARTVLHGARRWTDPFPWTLEVDGHTWSIDYSLELGWHAASDESIVTSDGPLVYADAHADGHYTVRVAKEHWNALKDLGRGVASYALREAIVAYLRMHGRVR